MQRHTVNALNSSFVINQDFQFVKELGQGAYGAVIATKNARTGDGCAIKKVTNINSKVRLFGFDVRYIGPDYLSLQSTIEDFNEEMFARDEVRKFRAIWL